MATRERKARNPTDSPISVSTDSTPSTPAAAGGRGRGGRGKGRGKRGRTASNATDTTNNDDNESTQSNEDEQSGKQTPQPTQAVTRAAKEESEEQKSPTKVEPATRPPSRRSKTAAAAVVAPVISRARRSNAGVVRRGGKLAEKFCYFRRKLTLNCLGGVLKRRSLPAGANPRRRGAANRRSLPAKVVKEAVAEQQQERRRGTPGRKPRAKVIPKKEDEELAENNDVFKKPAGISNEVPDSGAATDTEISNARRRRSSSKSTDTVASCPETIDATLVKREEVDVKLEKSEEEEESVAEKQDILDKMAENFSEAKVKDIDVSQLKRSGRPRRATVPKELKPRNTRRVCVIEVFF